MINAIINNAFITNALTGMSTALITLLLTFEYLERPGLQYLIRRICWGHNAKRVTHGWSGTCTIPDCDQPAITEMTTTGQPRWARCTHHYNPHDVPWRTIT